MDTGNVMSRSSRRDYWQRIYPRYQRANGTERQRILDEFCANGDYNRKYAIRLLNGPPSSGRPGMLGTRHAAAHRFLLLRQPHLAHAAFTEQ